MCGIYISKKRENFMKKIINNLYNGKAWLLLLVVGFNMNSCFQSHSPNLREPFFPSVVDSEQYTKDTIQIKDCYIANVDYYRTHPEKLDEGNLFNPYTYDYDKDSSGQTMLSTPAFENLRVYIGGVYYSPDKLRAFIFIAVEFPLHQKKVQPSYNAMCLIGLRNNINDKFVLYPLQKYTVRAYSNYKIPLNDVETWYFNFLSKSTDMWGKSFRTNVGDTDFWANNLLFDTVITSESFEYHKSDFPAGEKLYYFQTYSVSNMDDEHWDNHYRYDVIDCNR